jgi:hypothetical protein
MKPPVIVTLDTDRLDVCVGRYEVAAGGVFPTGMKLTVWREGEQLFAQARGCGPRSFLLGAFPIFPESETNFLEKLTGAQLRFIKNEQGQVTGLIHHSTGATLDWFADWEAKKISPQSLRPLRSD